MHFRQFRGGCVTYTRLGQTVGEDVRHSKAPENTDGHLYGGCYKILHVFIWLNEQYKGQRRPALLLRYFWFNQTLTPDKLCKHHSATMSKLTCQAA